MLRSLTVLMTVVGLAASGCTMRARRPDGPYRAALELVDALSDEAVECVREYAPKGQGEVVIAADLTPAGQAPAIEDVGSSAGNAAVIACIRAKASAQLHNPETAPARFARIRVPLPLVTSEVSYAFMPELPSASAKPAERPAP